MTGLRNVLVVEPADDRGGVSDTLRRAGLAIDSASDGARAVAAIAANRYALIVVDVATPSLSAAALVEALRSVTPRAMTLILSDEYDELRRIRAADVIHGYLRRDTEPEQIAELVHDCLAALHAGRGMSAPSTAAEWVPTRPM